MSPLFFLFISVSLLVGEGFIHKSKLHLHAVNSISMASSATTSKVEIMNLCSRTVSGEPVSESLALSIKEEFEKLELESSHKNLIDNMSYLEGEWLTIYSTLPRFYQRITLMDLSADTLKSAEPLIIMSSVTQVLRQKEPGVYYYDNRIKFLAGKVDVPPIVGKHTSRGYAKHNIPDSTDSTIRLDVEFYENEAQAVSPSKADGNDFNILFGYPVEDTILAAYPPNFKAWVDIVYLDEDLRLMRGSRGNFYILSKGIQDNLKTI